MTVLHVPTEKVLFAADIVQHRMTAFLLEGRVRAWVAQLPALRERFHDVETLYPGHGDAGPANDLIDAQIEYLEAFIRLAAEGGGAPDLVATRAAAAMRERYPGYQPVAAIPDLLDQDAAALVKEVAS
jgi:glyoxylase-like metal-dependent hydrolase (beta-lactamase superfamily II)